MNNRSTIETAEKKAYQYELVRSGCCSSVVLALQEIFSMRNDDVLKAASCFVGGVGGTHNMCGALAGGVFVLGLRYGWGVKEIAALLNGEPDPRSPDVILLTRKLVSMFEEEYNGTTCSEVQKKFFGRVFSSDNPQDIEEFEKLGGHTEIEGNPAVCPSVAARVARWVTEMICEEEATENKQ